MLYTKKRAWLFVMALLALVVVACTPGTGQGGEDAGDQSEPALDDASDTEPGQSDEGAESSQDDSLLADIMGVDWDLVSLAGEAPVAGSRGTLAIDGVNLAGSTGCNSYSAGYTLDADRLTVSEIAQTEMFCEGLMDQEMAFLKALGAVESISLEGEQLTLHSAEGDLVFQPSSPVALEGTSWTLNGIMRGDGFVSTYLDDEITAEFIDGQMAGSAGCNRYFASYEVDGDSLTIGPAGATRMSCGEERDEREREFLTALESVAGFKIQREVLTLTDAEGATVIQFRVPNN